MRNYYTFKNLFYMLESDNKEMDIDCLLNLECPDINQFFNEIDLKKLESLRSVDIANLMSIDDLIVDIKTEDDYEETSDESVDSSDFATDHSECRVPCINDFEARTNVTYVLLPFKQRRTACLNEQGSLCDEELNQLTQLEIKIEADKGFNYLPAFDAYVCQKKNHFQITAQILTNREVRYLKSKGGEYHEIDHYRLNIYGVKHELQKHVIEIKQSNPVDRKHYDCEEFHLPKLEIMQPNRITASRLHFALTTGNNKYKNNKPNDLQRYFRLIVEFQAVTKSGQHWVIYAVESEKLIVRAKNLTIQYNEKCEKIF